MLGMIHYTTTTSAVAATASSERRDVARCIALSLSLWLALIGFIWIHIWGQHLDGMLFVATAPILYTMFGDEKNKESQQKMEKMIRIAFI